MGWLLKGAAGAGLVALGANVALVLSAIPAVAGKGAPYMPTLQRALHATFDKELPKLLPLVGRAAPVAGEGPVPSVPHVVDLGSGDGRVVLAAARRGYCASGFEINPMLVGFSQVWAAIDRRRWPASGSASFACRDLWTLDLSDADVVFVYGLSPIMKRLSTKLLEEAPTAIIVSNVFELDPSKWRKLASSQEAHFYVARAAAPSSNAHAQSETAPQAPAAVTRAL